MGAEQEINKVLPEHGREAGGGITALMKQGGAMLQKGGKNENI